MKEEPYGIVIEIRVRNDYPGDVDRLVRKMSDLAHHAVIYDYRREEEKTG